MTPDEETAWGRLENALRQRDLAEGRTVATPMLAGSRAEKRRIKAGLSAERADALAKAAQAEAEAVLNAMMPGDLSALERAARTLVQKRGLVYYADQAENLDAMMRRQGVFYYRAVTDSLMGITYRLEELPVD